MTPADLLTRCQDAGVKLGAVRDTLLWECVGGLPPDLLAPLTENKADLLTLLTGPHGNCECGRPLDDRRRCWRCCDRVCSGCGRTTGSAFIELCWPCGFACHDGEAHQENQ